MDSHGKYLRVLLIFAATTLLTKVVHSFGNNGRIAGPADIILKSIQECPKRMQGGGTCRIHSSTGYNPKDRPYEFIWTANVSLLQPLDDSVTGEIHLAQWNARGGWKTGIKNMRFPQPCTTLARFGGTLWENILVAAYGEKKSCPIPPVQYAQYNNLSLNTRFFRIQDFIYGRWRSDVVLISDGKTKGCLRVFVDIAPRPASDG